MTTPGWHVLVVGNGRDIPGRLRRSRDDIRVTMMVREEIVGRVREPADNWAIIGLPRTQPERWVQYAQLINSVDPIHAVANFGEKDQEKFALICQDLGLRGPSPETLECVTDKTAMRRRLAEHGLDDTASRMVTTRAEAEEFIAEHGLPAVLKPAAGLGSAGVTIVSTAADLDEALTRADAASDGGAHLIIEAFLDGPEWSVEGFSENGEHAFASITKKFKTEVHCIEYAHVVRAEIDADLARDVLVYVGRALDALGIRDGITHTEVICTPRGPRLVETHLRPAGDELPEMLRDHYGIDLIDAIVSQAAGLPALDTVRRQIAAAEDVTEHIAIYYAFPPAAGGVVERITGEDEARAADGVCGLEVLVGVQDRLDPDALDSDSRTVEVKAVGATEDEALSRARHAAELVRFEVIRP